MEEQKRVPIISKYETESNWMYEALCFLMMNEILVKIDVHPGHEADPYGWRIESLEPEELCTIHQAVTGETWYDFSVHSIIIPDTFN